MNTVLTFIKTILSKISDVFKNNVTIFTLIFIFGSGAFVGWYFTHKYYAPKLTTLQTEYDNFKAEYQTTVDKGEQTIINKAIADKIAKKPVTEKVTNESSTSIEYTQKTSASDADISVTSTPSTIQLEYNGVKTALTTTDTSSTSKTADNKVVINQQSVTTLNVDDIVNRQIANTILEKNHEEDVLKREKKQNLFWGAVGGLAIGYVVGHH